VQDIKLLIYIYIYIYIYIKLLILVTLYKWMVASICFTFSSRLDVVSYKTLDVSILFPIYIYISFFSVILTWLLKILS
jgi:hypothetical protein